MNTYQILSLVETCPRVPTGALIREGGIWEKDPRATLGALVATGLLQRVPLRMNRTGYILSHKGRRYLDLVRGE